MEGVCVCGCVLNGGGEGVRECVCKGGGEGVCVCV